MDPYPGNNSHYRGAWEDKSSIQIQDRSELAGVPFTSSPSPLPPSYKPSNSSRQPRMGGQRFYEEQDAPWYDFKEWRKRTWAIIVAVVVIAVVAVAVAVTQVDKKEAYYPNYSELNYTLIDTCECRDKTSRACWKHKTDGVTPGRFGDGFL